MSPWLFHWQCYDSARGGQAKLDADATKWAGLSKSRFIGEQRTYSDKHHGSRWGEHGVIQYHAMVVEPMHGCHMEFNVLMGESSHEHLLVVSNDKVVKDKIVEATREINELWGSVHTQQRYYFGRDSDGKPQPSPSVIGPDMKIILAHPTLLPRHMEIMSEVWELTEPERKKQSTEKPKEMAKAARQEKAKAKQPSSFCEIAASDDDSDDEPGEAAARPANAAPKKTYHQLVALAFSRFIDVYEYLHRHHDEKASAVSFDERHRRADEACDYLHKFQQDMINLIGEHKRRAYAHDLYYGVHKLYELFSKPWGGSTEGAEHAHQEVKRMFLTMSCHSRAHAEKYHGPQYQTLDGVTVKQQLCRERAELDLNPSEYNATKAACTFVVKKRVAAPAPAPARGGARRGRGRGARGRGRAAARTVLVEHVVGAKEEKFKRANGAPSKMLAVRDALREIAS